MTNFGKGCYWGSYCVWVWVWGEGRPGTRALSEACTLSSNKSLSLPNWRPSAFRYSALEPSCHPQICSQEQTHSSKSMLAHAAVYTDFPSIQATTSVGFHGASGIPWNHLPSRFLTTPLLFPASCPLRWARESAVMAKTMDKKWLKTFWLCMGNLLAEILLKKFYFCTTCKERTRKFVEKLLACSSFQEKITLLF